MGVVCGWRRWSCWVESCQAVCSVLWATLGHLCVVWLSKVLQVAKGGESAGKVYMVYQREGKRPQALQLPLIMTSPPNAVTVCLVVYCGVVVIVLGRLRRLEYSWQSHSKPSTMDSSLHKRTSNHRRHTSNPKMHHPPLPMPPAPTNSDLPADKDLLQRWSTHNSPNGKPTPIIRFIKPRLFQFDRPSDYLPIACSR
jgi:hypothetical protein